MLETNCMPCGCLHFLCLGLWFFWKYSYEVWVRDKLIRKSDCKNIEVICVGGGTKFCLRQEGWRWMSSCIASSCRCSKVCSQKPTHGGLSSTGKWNGAWTSPCIFCRCNTQKSYVSRKMDFCQMSEQVWGENTAGLDVAKWRSFFSIALLCYPARTVAMINRY